MADAFVRRRPDLQIASMRFHALWNPETAQNYMKNGDKTATGGRAALGLQDFHLPKYLDGFLHTRLLGHTFPLS